MNEGGVACYSHGGWVEEEPKQHDLQGKGFTKANIDYQKDEYDVDPDKFAEGGKVMPKMASLKELYKRRFMAKKMASGGPVPDFDMAEEYPADLEVAEEDSDNTYGEGLRHEATEGDKDRTEFVRRFMVRKMLRKA